jgi:CRISPR-associated protein Csm1
MQEQDNKLLVLAALLHDVGKLAQRAGAPQSKDMEGELCPSHYKGGYSTHKHVLYTDAFLENPDLLPLPPEFEGQRSRLARLAAAHHKPGGDSTLEQILCRADRLSAGADRIQGEASEGDYKSARLTSVFNQISLHREMSVEALSAKQHAYHKLKPLTHTDDLESSFPVGIDEARTTDYKQHYQGFVSALQALPCTSGWDVYLAALLGVLEQYMWCVPSSTYNTLSDISLYDHSYTTAAIAQALWFAEKDRGETPGDESECFMLLGGDLSGIQQYIFGIDKSHSAGTAKIFRARSFYLQLLTRSVITTLLQDKNLEPVARVMDAGGRFVLLLPATDQMRTYLDELELQVQQWFYAQFHGQLSLNLAWSTQLTPQDLEQSNFEQQHNRCNQELEEKKLQRFQRLFAAGMNPVADLDYSRYQEGACALCQIEPADPGAIERFAKKHNRTSICCKCLEQIEVIGTAIPRKEYLLLEKSDKPSANPLYGDLKMRFANDVKPEEASRAVEVIHMRRRGLAAYQAIAGHMPVVAEEELTPWHHAGLLQKNSDGEYLYQNEPLAAGDSKTFHLLADSAQRITSDTNNNLRLQGRAFLGALKADVDNLGFIFSIGLGKRLSLSRFTSVSRMLNHFFAEYLTAYIQKKYPDIYLVFAGGDDLFLIGPWVQTVAFARDMHRQFRAFVAEEKDITISAGLCICKPALPMQRIADNAEELLDHDAKQLKGKNGVSLFGVTVNWQRWEELLGEGDNLLNLLEDEKVTSGLVNRLLRYGDYATRFKDGKLKYGIYKSHMVYDMHRNLKLEPGPERDRILGLQQDETLMQQIRLPVSYALYQWRT